MTVEVCKSWDAVEAKNSEKHLKVETRDFIWMNKFNKEFTEARKKDPTQYQKPSVLRKGKVVQKRIT